MLWLMIFSYSDKTIGQSYADRHSNVSGDAWLSTAPLISPNATRGVLHWIKYDLGDTYAMHRSKFWNVNTPDLTNAGAQKIIIDYSIDGIKWYEWGRYSLTQSNGSTMYEGEDGPDFGGLVARYVLINIVNNFGNATYTGLAELKINVSPATVSVKDNLLKDLTLTAAPNPFSTATRIKIENADQFEGLSYQVTDINGKLLQSGSADRKEVNVDAGSLPSGVYNFSVIHASGIKTLQIEVVK